MVTQNPTQILAPSYEEILKNCSLPGIQDPTVREILNSLSESNLPEVQAIAVAAAWIEVQGSKAFSNDDSQLAINDPESLQVSKLIREASEWSHSYLQHTNLVTSSWDELRELYAAILFTMLQEIDNISDQ